ncbi:unnamed protein product [Pleuronectes platessa]|uniref:Uncharacterized protein n=1 Tax=Pleuronectes platessa TaxID=8262 RepID=A0A9N7YAU1_PLEPL|nr:unnamed protein product [Pleuronectes platessa]
MLNELSPSAASPPIDAAAAPFYATHYANELHLSANQAFAGAVFPPHGSAREGSRCVRSRSTAAFTLCVPRPPAASAAVAPVEQSQQQPALRHTRMRNFSTFIPPGSLSVPPTRVLMDGVA